MIGPSLVTTLLEQAASAGDLEARSFTVVIGLGCTREQLITALEINCPQWEVTVSEEVDSVVTVSAVPKE